MMTVNRPKPTYRWEMTVTNPAGLPVLETKCPDRRGVGGDEEAGQWFWCPECRGAGYIPTPFGERILALMRHNFRPMYEEVQCE